MPALGCAWYACGRQQLAMRVQEVADGGAPAVFLAGRAQQWAAADGVGCESVAAFNGIAGGHGAGVRGDRVTACGGLAAGHEGSLKRQAA
jgi:hypothetical protein